jgi:hypothetical protein
MKKNDDYYDCLKFLSVSEDIEIETKNDKKTFNNSNYWTIDQLSNTPSLFDLEKSSIEMIAQENSQFDPILTKSSAQVLMESPELNKKVRIQKELELIMNNNERGVKEVSKKFEKIVSRDDSFDLNYYKSDNEKKEIILKEIKKFYQLKQPYTDISSNVKINDISNETRKKIYKVKKTKKDEDVITLLEKDENIERNNNYKYILKIEKNQGELQKFERINNKNKMILEKISFIFGSSMLTLLVLKKLKAKFRL